GFDIGGTRLKSGVVSASGAVSGPCVLNTEHRRFDWVLERLLEEARTYLAEFGDSGLRGVGVALPGIVQSEFGSRNLPGKVLGIENFPLHDTLEREFAVPVRCVNDGNAATLAEWRFGAARGYDDVVGFTLGTGVGGGVVMNGRLLENAHFGVVSLGHFTIQAGGKLCLCGNKGCAETLVSADAVASRLRDYLGRSVPSVLNEVYFRDPASITFRSLIEGVEQGDRVCLEVLEHFRRDLGALVVTAIHAYNPSAVVLAGGPLAAADHFLPHVQAYVDRYAFVFPKDRRVPVLRAREENYAGVLGAVALVMQAEEREAGPEETRDEDAPLEPPPPAGAA
ncbi:MAG: ROK family protein, partial [Chloroflexota bacterium]|nr:ROK family protein [Chloroflexota bacterium]